jgi:hypothetical protein
MVHDSLTAQHVSVGLLLLQVSQRIGSGWSSFKKDWWLDHQDERRSLSSLWLVGASILESDVTCVFRTCATYP